VPSGVELAAGLTCSVIVNGHQDFGDDLKAVADWLRDPFALRPMGS